MIGFLSVNEFNYCCSLHIELLLPVWLARTDGKYFNRGAGEENDDRM